MCINSMKQALSLDLQRYILESWKQKSRRLNQRSSMAIAEPEFHNGVVKLTKMEAPDQLWNWYNESKRQYKKRPVLSPTIRVFFPHENVEYTGVYLDHGTWKTVYELKLNHRAYTYLDGEVLKVAQHHDGDGPHPCKEYGDVLKVTRDTDIEPEVFRHLRNNCPQCDIVTPEVLYEATGYDQDERFHCWITERCIPMHQVLTCDKINKERCVLGVCRCIAKAAAKGVRISDCFFKNFGVLVTNNDRQHNVVILDAGCREILQRDIAKPEVNTYMKKLWQWALDVGAPVEYACRLWKIGWTLTEVIAVLDEQWYKDPTITLEHRTMRAVEEELGLRVSRARQYDWTDSRANLSGASEHKQREMNCAKGLQQQVRDEKQKGTRNQNQEEKRKQSQEKMQEEEQCEEQKEIQAEAIWVSAQMIFRMSQELPAIAAKTIKSDARFVEDEDMPADFVSRINEANVGVSDVGDVMTEAVDSLYVWKPPSETGAAEHRREPHTMKKHDVVQRLWQEIFKMRRLVELDDLKPIDNTHLLSYVYNQWCVSWLKENLNEKQLQKSKDQQTIIYDNWLRNNYGSRRFVMAILKTGLSWATTSGAAEHSGSASDANDHNVASVDPQRIITKFMDWILQLAKAINMQKKERSVEEQSRKSDDKENSHGFTNEETVRGRDPDVARKEYERAEDVPRASELYKGEGKGKGKGKREFKEAKYRVEVPYASISTDTKRFRLAKYQ